MENNSFEDPSRGEDPAANPRATPERASSGSGEEVSVQLLE
jgi:hypothetical protein